MATEVRLRDGTRAVVWGLLPSDREGLRDAYEHLSPETKLHRFLTPVPHLTEGMLHRLVDEVDGVDHVARVLFVLDEQGVGRPAGLARMIRYADRPSAADVAVTVTDEYQGRGVASALLEDLLRHRPAGVDRIVTEVAADNPASLAMLRGLGPTTVEHDGVHQLCVSVALPPPARDRRPPRSPEAQAAGSPEAQAARSPETRAADGPRAGSTRS